MSRLARQFLIALLISVFYGPAAQSQTPPADADNPTVAFYYGVKPPLTELQAFDIAVVEPEFVKDPAQHTRSNENGTHELFAYVSLGEVQPSRPYYRDLPKGSLRADNAAWGSRAIDQNAPGWSEFFLSKIIAPLWNQGWRGFFIDTLDSYQLFAKTDAERQLQVQAMVNTLRELKRRYPQARLILNRGFELLPEIAPLTYAVAAESLYQGYDAGQKQYRAVSEQDRNWLLAQLQQVRDRYKLPVIAIDYVAPGKPKSIALARETAARIRALGLIPWVADGNLSSVGIGNIEVLPRTVLVLTSTDPGGDLHYTAAQRFLGMPLNYLGLRYEFVDLTTESLPEGIMAGRYAGIVGWFRSGEKHPALGSWLKRRIDEGVPVVMLGDFGFNLDAMAASSLGLQVFNAARSQQIKIVSSDARLVGFESEVLPDRDQLMPLRLIDKQAQSLLHLTDNNNNQYDPVAITAWGGYALDPFLIQDLAMLDQSRWIIQPLEFLKRALRLPALPVPDVTTEAGRRILISHIDGDGFASRAELPGSPFGADVLRKEILERYRIPTTVSVIEGELSARGVSRNASAALEAIARSIFALPSVEAASHSYSHPFSWAKAMGTSQSEGIDDAGKIYNLPLPGYKFDLHREVQGSMDYINKTLMPKDKVASVFLWSGDCVPPAAAIAETYRDGFLNMNGGDTLITDSSKSWTRIAAQGLRKNGWYQVFAPNQNENVYTHNWTGPFYGFERVIETYKLTESPYRFKPVDIYYHFYSATKPASLAALHKVYRWATAQPLAHLYSSQYIRKVLDFENTSIARDLVNGDLLVRTGADLRTLRMPVNALSPSIASSAGLAGIAPGPSGAYLTLAAGQTRLSAKADVRKPAYVVQASGALSALSRVTSGATDELRFTLRSNGRAGFSLAHATACTVSVDGKTISATVNQAFPSAASADPQSNPPAERYAPGVTVQEYDLGYPTNNLATTRHLALVRCPV